MSETAIYIQIAGINGDATDNNYNQWSQLKSLSLGVHRQTNPQMSHSSSSTPLAATFNEVCITKKPDSMGPQLFSQVANVQGTKIAKVQIDVTAAGSNNVLETYVFKNVVFTSFDVSVDEADVTHTAKFSYENYDYSYFPRDNQNNKQSTVRITGTVGR